MSVYKRKSGRWGVLIDIDRGADGKRQRRAFGTYATRKDAERAQREALAAKDRGVDLAPQTVSVAQVAERFLKDVRSRVAAKTLERYEDLIKRNILPHIGTLTLAKLKPVHLGTLYANLLERGRADGKGGLSPRTIGHVHALIREMRGKQDRGTALHADQVRSSGIEGALSTQGNRMATAPARLTQKIL